MQGIYDPNVKVKLYESGCSTFSEAVQLAKRIEGAKNVVETPKDTTSLTDHVFEVSDSPGNRPITSTGSPRAPVECWQCGKLGHIKRNCRSQSSNFGPRNFAYNPRNGFNGPPRNTRNWQPPRSFDRPQAQFRANNDPCSYCSLPNHKADSCFKLKRDMQSNSLNTPGTSPGPSTRTE